MSLQQGIALVCDIDRYSRLEATPMITKPADSDYRRVELAFPNASESVHVTVEDLVELVAVLKEACRP